LAKQGLQTINETAQNTSSHYKATWTAFKSLKKKGLIKKQNVKEYRSRKYPQYWLTMDGLVAALKNGADLHKAKENMQDVLGKHESIDLFFELAVALGKRNLPRFANLFELTEQGEFKLTKLPTMRSSRAKKILKIVKKYPMFRKGVKKSAKEILDLMEE